MNYHEASLLGGHGLPGLGPIELEALLVPKVWGGNALQSLCKAPGTTKPIGEAWLLYDRPSRSNAVRESQDSLAQLRETWGPELIGSAKEGYGGRFPVLIKYLHAREVLSLQVHPSDAEAIGDGGKEECWLVLIAGRSAKAYLGLKEDVTIDRFAAGLSTGEINELLNVVKLKAGDVVHVPPGTVHALGGDALVLEVQQNSDITHRLSDWGRGRPVHVNDALQCVDIQSRPELNQQVTDIGGGGLRLITTPSFCMFRYQLNRPVEIATQGGYCALVGLNGGGSVTAGGHERGISREALLVPACHKSFFVHPIDCLDLVICAPGNITVTNCKARR